MKFLTILKGDNLYRHIDKVIKKHHVSDRLK